MKMLDDAKRKKLIKKCERKLHKELEGYQVHESSFFLTQKNGRSSYTTLKNNLAAALEDYKTKETTNLYNIYIDLGTVFYHSKLYMTAMLLESAQKNTPIEVVIKHIHICYWLGYYTNKIYLIDIYQEKLPANFKLQIHQPEKQMTWAFLSIALGHVPTNEPLFQWFRQNEDLNVIRSTSLDMPLYQFLRWMLEYWQAGERPKYTIRSHLYQQVDQYWENDEKLSEVIYEIMDHHLILLAGKPTEAAAEHNAYYPQYDFVPMWHWSNDIIPLEILALRQLRLHHGLSWPDVNHPLLHDVYIEAFDAAKKSFQKLDDEVFNLLDKLAHYFPDDQVLLDYLKTAELFIPESEE